MNSQDGVDGGDIDDEIAELRYQALLTKKENEAEVSSAHEPLSNRNNTMGQNSLNMPLSQFHQHQNHPQQPRSFPRRGGYRGRPHYNKPYLQTFSQQMASNSVNSSNIVVLTTPSTGENFNNPNQYGNRGRGGRGRWNRGRANYGNSEAMSNAHKSQAPTSQLVLPQDKYSGSANPQTDTSETNKTKLSARMRRLQGSVSDSEDSESDSSDESSSNSSSSDSSSSSSDSSSSGSESESENSLNHSKKTDKKKVVTAQLESAKEPPLIENIVSAESTKSLSESNTKEIVSSPPKLNYVPSEMISKSFDQRRSLSKSPRRRSPIFNRRSKSPYKYRSPSPRYRKKMSPYSPRRGRSPIRRSFSLSPRRYSRKRDLTPLHVYMTRPGPLPKLRDKSKSPLRVTHSPVRRFGSKSPSYKSRKISPYSPRPISPFSKAKFDSQIHRRLSRSPRYRSRSPLPVKRYSSRSPRRYRSRSPRPLKHFNSISPPPNRKRYFSRSPGKWTPRKRSSRSITPRYRYSPRGSRSPLRRRQKSSPLSPRKIDGNLLSSVGRAISPLRIKRLGSISPTRVLHSRLSPNSRAHQRRSPLNCARYRSPEMRKKFRSPSYEKAPNFSRPPPYSPPFNRSKLSPLRVPPEPLHGVRGPIDMYPPSNFPPRDSRPLNERLPLSPRSSRLISNQPVRVWSPPVAHYPPKGPTPYDDPYRPNDVPLMGSPPPNFPGPRQGISGPRQGFSGSRQGFSGSRQGFSGSRQGFSGLSQGFSGPRQRFPGPNTEFNEHQKNIYEPRQNYPEIRPNFSATQQGLLGPHPGYNEQLQHDRLQFEGDRFESRGMRSPGNSVHSRLGRGGSRPRGHLDDNNFDRPMSNSNTYSCRPDDRTLGFDLPKRALSPVVPRGYPLGPKTPPDSPKREPSPPEWQKRRALSSDRPQSSKSSRLSIDRTLHRETKISTENNRNISMERVVPYKDKPLLEEKFRRNDDRSSYREGKPLGNERRNVSVDRISERDGKHLNKERRNGSMERREPKSPLKGKGNRRHERSLPRDRKTSNPLDRDRDPEKNLNQVKDSQNGHRNENSKRNPEDIGRGRNNNKTRDTRSLSKERQKRLEPQEASRVISDNSRDRPIGGSSKYHQSLDRVSSDYHLQDRPPSRDSRSRNHRKPQNDRESKNSKSGYKQSRDNDRRATDNSHRDVKKYSENVPRSLDSRRSAERIHRDERVSEERNLRGKRRSTEKSIGENRIREKSHRHEQENKDFSRKLDRRSCEKNINKDNDKFHKETRRDIDKSRRDKSRNSEDYSESKVKYSDKEHPRRPSVNRNDQLSGEKLDVRDGSKDENSSLKGKDSSIEFSKDVDKKKNISNPLDETSDHINISLEVESITEDSLQDTSKSSIVESEDKALKKRDKNKRKKNKDGHTEKKKKKKKQKDSEEKKSHKKKKKKGNKKKHKRIEKTPIDDAKKSGSSKKSKQSDDSVVNGKNDLRHTLSQRVEKRERDDDEPYKNAKRRSVSHHSFENAQLVRSPEYDSSDRQNSHWKPVSSASMYPSPEYDRAKYKVSNERKFEHKKKMLSVDKDMDKDNTNAGKIKDYKSKQESTQGPSFICVTVDKQNDRKVETGPSINEERELARSLFTKKKKAQSSRGARTQSQRGGKRSQGGAPNRRGGDVTSTVSVHDRLSRKKSTAGNNRRGQDMGDGNRRRGGYNDGRRRHFQGNDRKRAKR